MKTRYVFGDIHGHYDTLLQLLDKLDLDPNNLPDQVELVFLGDLIDRGPKSFQVVELVKSLCEQGKARCILANHEFNFVNFNTETVPKSGIYRRPRKDKNLTEIAETWASYRINGKHQTEQREAHIAWFKTLPVAIELDGLNVVHACWHAPSLALLEKRGDGYYLSDENWEKAWIEGDPIFDAVENICKGVERYLDGQEFRDGNGVPRKNARVRWWDPEPKSWDDYIVVPNHVRENIQLNGKPPSNCEFAVTTPTLFGHYWREGEPTIETPLASCIDYSVASDKGGYLCAYKFCEGDTELHQDQLFYVKRDQRSNA